MAYRIEVRRVWANVDSEVVLDEINDFNLIDDSKGLYALESDDRKKHEAFRRILSSGVELQDVNVHSIRHSGSLTMGVEEADEWAYITLVVWLKN